MKSFQCETLIRAKPETVWRILTDAPNYPAWNTTVTKVEGTIALGQKITVHAKISPDRAFPVKVTALEAPTRMVWTGGMPLGLFKGERTFTLTPEAGGVRFSMREQFTGLFAGLITKSMPDLGPAFEELAACLEAKAEAED